MLSSPGAIAISTPFISIYWYGIIVAFAFFIGLGAAAYFGKKIYNDNNVIENIYEIAFWVLLGGIVGARLYFVLLSLPYYLQNPVEILMINKGGLSIHGGLLGGMIAGYFYIKKHNLSFFKYADLFALALPLGQAVGRWGNFFNSEAFGKPADIWWGVKIPLENRPEIYKAFEVFHPAFLYESLWNIFIFLVLYFVIKRFFIAKEGIVFFSYLLLYSIGRILIETVRVDSVLNILEIPVAVWVSLVLCAVSVGGLFISLKEKTDPS
ncbi:MAG: prolipoprotein diacylglyceryl transferase [Candidatus Gastranaerophilales bacterium]|nr:prolipoprotein diacylglyceryl transferase [Candidatus Gastranaerophilales bacterium]